MRIIDEDNDKELWRCMAQVSVYKTAHTLGMKEAYNNERHYKNFDIGCVMEKYKRLNFAEDDKDNFFEQVMRCARKTDSFIKYIYINPTLYLI